MPTHQLCTVGDWSSCPNVNQPDKQSRYLTLIPAKCSSCLYVNSKSFTIQPYYIAPYVI